VARSGSGAAGGSKTLAAAARVEASPGRPRGGRRERAKAFFGEGLVEGKKCDVENVVRDDMRMRMTV
jgi:hypothetical protein